MMSDHEFGTPADEAEATWYHVIRQSAWLRMIPVLVPELAARIDRTID
jgi:hypothetical protein